ncbi:hypothetical protein [Ketobacter sp.]|uniref:hypothetical protein n=1 Tax=Ketobacter sp. TaxID=2083498 RepID=UPI000F26F92E|nr:hypothetical protein [Ketobacter sp.]RLT92981.1 MAG: hypothetical protein D9N14_19175 [Ketobacter sp.]
MHKAIQSLKPARWAVVVLAIACGALLLRPEPLQHEVDATTATPEVILPTAEEQVPWPSTSALPPTFTIAAPRGDDLTDDNTTADDIAHDNPPDLQTIHAAYRQQLQYLREITPDNRLIPAEKTDWEVEQMLAEMERHRTLQQRMDDHTATPEERQEYVALHRYTLEDELELLRLCEDVAANSLEPEAIQQAQLCRHVLAAAPQRLPVIEARLMELDALLAKREQ